jgi:hypothetical protein
MALSHVELYEALKPSIGEEAASLIADVFPPAKELATKTDIAEVRGELRGGFAELRSEMRETNGELRAEMREANAELRAEMREGFAQLRIIRWLFGLFLPVWLGTWATFVVYLIKK